MLDTFNVEQIFSSVPVQVGGARRACGAGALPWMSRKDLVGLHSMAQGLTGLDLPPAPALLQHIWLSDGACKPLMDQTPQKLRAADFSSRQKNAFGKESWRWPYQSCGALQRSSLGQKVRECPGEMLADGGCRGKWPGALTLSAAGGNALH